MIEMDNKTALEMLAWQYPGARVTADGKAVTPGMIVMELCAGGCHVTPIIVDTEGNKIISYQTRDVPEGRDPVDLYSEEAIDQMCRYAAEKMCPAVWN